MICLRDDYLGPRLISLGKLRLCSLSKLQGYAGRHIGKTTDILKTDAQRHRQGDSDERLGKDPGAEEKTGCCFS